jgi:uncharacterized protein (TIGR02246 family)
MRSITITVLLFSAAALVLGACSPTSTSSTSEEAAIRAQNAKWLEAIAKHDADAVAAIYAQDGEFLPPNSAKVTGRESIKAAWQAMFQIPGVGLTFATDKFVFGSSNDLAVDIGSYEFKSSSGGSSASDKGKSVVTWVKRDGNWQVLTDMFSSDAPMLQSTPSVPAAAATTPVPATPTTPPTTTTTPTPAPATPPAH